MIIKSAIVGWKHHKGAEKKLRATKQNTPVTLVREPENEHDPNAIRCEIDGIMCGFIPAAQAERLAADIDGGESVSAVLRGFNSLEIEIGVNDVENTRANES